MEKKLKIVIGLTVKLSGKTTLSHPNSTLYRNSWIRFPALVTASTDPGRQPGMAHAVGLLPCTAAASPAPGMALDQPLHFRHLKRKPASNSFSISLPSSLLL